VLSGYQALFSMFGGGVAVWAHIGGFVAGYLLVSPSSRRRPPPEAPRRLRLDLD
jgi:membrane associated rhomboid family serine protease